MCKINSVIGLRYVATHDINRLCVPRQCPSPAGLPAVPHVAYPHNAPTPILLTRHGRCVLGDDGIMCHDNVTYATGMKLYRVSLISAPHAVIRRRTQSNSMLLTSRASLLSTHLGHVSLRSTLTRSSLVRADFEWHRMFQHRTVGITCQSTSQSPRSGDR